MGAFVNNWHSISANDTLFFFPSVPESMAYLAILGNCSVFLVSFSSSTCNINNSQKFIKPNNKKVFQRINI